MSTGPTENLSGHLPLAAYNCFASSDFAETHARLSTVLMPHQINPHGRRNHIDCLINRAKLGNVSFNVMRFGSAVTVRPGALREFYIVHLPLVGEVMAAVDGKTYRSGSQGGLILSPDVPLELEWEEDSVQLLIQIPRTRMEGYLDSLVGGGMREPILFRPDIDLESRTGQSCLTLINFMIDSLERNAILPGAPAEDMERVLLATLLGQLPHNRAEELGGNLTGRPYYVTRAERFMAQNIKEPITIADIVDAAGVSERTLHAGFRRYIGTTPLRRLRALRLARIHEVLSNSRPDEVKVSEVAARFGMFQFGQFAGLYKAAYGVSPSATLRRS